VLSVDSINKCDCASAITAAETGNMEIYRDLLNEFASLYVANNAFLSSKSILISECICSYSHSWSAVALACISTPCGNNILSHAASLDGTEVTVVLISP